MENPVSKPLVLFVDDDRLIRESFTRTMRKKPFEIITVESAEQAMEFMKKTTVHVVISDEAMKGTCGSDFLIWAAEWFPKTVRIMLTGQPNMNGMQNLLNNGGVFRFLSKPVDDVALNMSIYDALDSAGVTYETSV